MNGKGIGWIILAAVAILMLILVIIAIVAFNKMRESAVNFDVLSALGNYGIFLISGIIIVIVAVLLLISMRR